MKDVVVDEIKMELSKRCSKKEIVIKIMIEKSLKLGYDIDETIENILQYCKIY